MNYHKKRWNNLVGMTVHWNPQLRYQYNARVQSATNFRYSSLVIRNANRIVAAQHYISICCLFGSSIFLHITSYTAWHSEKKIIWM